MDGARVQATVGHSRYLAWRPESETSRLYASAPAAILVTTASGTTQGAIQRLIRAQTLRSVLPSALLGRQVPTRMRASALLFANTGCASVAIYLCSPAGREPVGGVTLPANGVSSEVGSLLLVVRAACPARLDWRVLHPAAS
jgi:hypothetical protein